MANLQVGLPEILGGITKTDNLEKHEQDFSRKQQKKDFRNLSIAVEQDPEAKQWLNDHKNLYSI